MALAVEEAQKTYEILSTKLKEVGLHWVLTQVEEKLSLGKVRLKKVSLKKYPDLLDDREFSEERLGRPRALSATLVASEEYSPHEQLQILIEAILVAVPSVYDIARFTIDTLKDFGKSEGILFAPESGESEAISLEAAMLDQHRDSVATLRTLIGELLHEVTDASPT